MFVLLAGESILSSLAKELTTHYNACDKKKKKKRKSGGDYFLGVYRKYILNIKEGKTVPRGKKKKKKSFDPHKLKHGRWCVGW